MAPEQQGRRDLIEYPLEDNVRLEVYWRDDRAGYGPAASVFAYDQEILRLDCFGEAKKQGGTGHCHINLKQNRARQWMYPAGTCQHSCRTSDARSQVQSRFLSCDKHR